MPKINLAQEALRNQAIARRRRVTYSLSGVVLIVVLGAYGLIFFLTTATETRTAEVQQEVGRLEAQLETRREDVRQVVLFRERLKNLATALAEHVRWSRIFEELERLTTTDATLLALKGSVEETALTAQVRVPSVDGAADLLASFQDRDGKNETFFSEVKATHLKPVEQTTDVTAPSAVVAYVLDFVLTVSKEAFRAPPEAAATAASPVPVPPLPEGAESSSPEV